MCYLCQDSPKMKCVSSTNLDLAIKGIQKESKGRLRVLHMFTWQAKIDCDSKLDIAFMYATLGL